MGTGAAPPSSTSEHVQGDAPQPVAVQSNHPESSPPDPATRTPSPYSAAELPHVGAPASSSPPVDSQPTPFKFDASFKAPPSKGPPFKFQAQQQQQEDSDSDSDSDDGFPRLRTEDLKRFQAWQQQQRQRKPWKTSLSPPHGPVWYEKLPYDIKYSCRQWHVLQAGVALPALHPATDARAHLVHPELRALRPGKPYHLVRAGVRAMAKIPFYVLTYSLTMARPPPSRSSGVCSSGRASCCRRGRARRGWLPQASRHRQRLARGQLERHGRETSC